MKDDKRRNTFDSLFDLFESAKTFYEENQETIQEVVETGNSVSLEDDDLLQEAYKQEDSVIVVTETKRTDLSDINFQFNEEEMSMTITMGGDNLKVMMPEDVKPKETEARIKNGVLRAEIPRENEDEDDGTSEQD
jgi:HSP20 family molecular chaperone IbpA